MSVNAVEMQQETTQSRRISVEYGAALAAGMNAQMACVLYYGSEDAYSGRTIRRGAHPTFGLAACLNKGELAVPARMKSGIFVAGSDIEELLKKAELWHETYVDVWQTEHYEDRCQDDVTYRRVTGRIRRYNVRAGEFEAEELITEEFVMADPERDARNAREAKKRRKRYRGEPGYNRGAAYGPCATTHRMSASLL